jgi:hypothetical protein
LAKTSDKTETRPEGLTRVTTLDRIREQKVDVREQSFDDLIKTLENEGDELVDVSDLGEGYKLVQGISGKKKLVGMPFIILKHKRQRSTKVPGSFFSSMWIKTATNDLLLVNDGSTGIHAQLEAYREQGVEKGIVCRRGLQVSEDYEVKDEEGNPVLNPATNKPILGTTFYLDTSV